MRRRLGTMLVVAVALMGAGAPLRAHHEPSYPPARGCVQGWDSGTGAGASVASSFGTAVVGSACRYEAIERGGYRVIAGDSWRVAIRRPDGALRILSSGAGSPRCMPGVIGRGDRVEVDADVGIVAGEGIGCQEHQGADVGSGGR